VSPISNLSKFDYDFENDTIFFYGTDKKYKTSIDIDDIILDVGEDNSAIAIEILDASKKFNVPKSDLSNILHFNAEISVSKETIKVIMKLVIKKRNGLINKFMEACGLNNNYLPVSTQEMALSY
jgi:uncharacterized protein YuzE